MPSSYTNNLGIELPADGELDGLWGDVVNANMNILDRAINGSITLSLSGTASTLTTTDGTLSNGQYKLLALGGTPSGTHTITISPNDAQKIYFVRNTTAQSVVFTQGSGGNVTIAAGDSGIIYSNGGGSSAAVALVLNPTTLSSLGVTASAAELNILDGVTASTAEINILDGVTASAAELNILDGVTASTAELNILDGVTASAAELNFVDGVTSAIQTQLNGKQALDAELTAIAALSTNGIVARTGAGTAAARSVAGTTDQITVTNGDGVAGNPTIAAVIASQAEAEAGTNAAKLMTPERTKQAIGVLSGGSFLIATVNIPPAAPTYTSSLNLTGLNLSGYKFLLFVMNNVGTPSTHLRIGNVQVTAGGLSQYGMVWLSLVTGRTFGTASNAASVGTIYIANTGYSTATTTINFSTPSVYFDGGSILVYGVK